MYSFCSAKIPAEAFTCCACACRYTILYSRCCSDTFDISGSANDDEHSIVALCCVCVCDLGCRFLRILQGEKEVNHFSTITTSIMAYTYEWFKCHDFYGRLFPSRFLSNFFSSFSVWILFTNNNNTYHIYVSAVFRPYFLVTFGHVDVHVIALLLPLLQHISIFFSSLCFTIALQTICDVIYISIFFLAPYGPRTRSTAHVLVFLLSLVLSNITLNIFLVSLLFHHIFPKQMINRSIWRCFTNDIWFFFYFLR